MAKIDNKYQKLGLGLLLVVLALFLMNNLYFEGNGEDGDAGSPNAGNSFNLGKLPPANMPVVQLELLERLNVPVKVTKNIFDPVYRPPVVQPPVKKQPPAANEAGRGKVNPNYVKPPPPKPRQELEADRARDELGKFRFVGFILRNETLDIFLAMGSDYYVSRPGETITGDYYIKEVRPDSIIIADRAHKLNGKEVEVSIKADFEGEDADVITGTSAPYVGVGATGSGGGKTSGGAKSRQGPPAGRPSGGRRGPAPPPRGIVGEQVPDPGRAATPGEEEEPPIGTEPGIDGESSAPDSLGSHTVM